MGWLTTSSATNQIIMEDEFSWDYREIGWSYGGRRVEYVVKRKKFIRTTRWVGMDFATAQTAAEEKLTGNAMRSAAIRGAGGEGVCITAEESYPSGSTWVLSSITIRWGTDV